MRVSHFEAFKPVCPQCRSERHVIAPLTLASVLKQQDNNIMEGVLHCSNEQCQLEYPIIDGIPIIIPYVRKYISDNLPHITARDDFSETIESILGDCAGPGTLFDATRQHLSSYAWDHYHDLDPNRNSGADNVNLQSSVISCLKAGLELINKKVEGPVIDIGCSVGRTTFELANKSQQLALGIDVNFSMLKVAHKVLHENTVRYPLRRIGIVYDQQEYNVQLVNTELVDFWACDALALPFAENSIGFASGFNVFDSVTSPRDLLASIAYTLNPGGNALLATPYDWSPAATPLETWIGGHSQRGPDGGAAEPFLKRLLTPGAHPQSIENLQLIGEIANFPWTVRVHERSETVYKTHIFAVKATQ